ncbi:MAG: hypothetical protein E6R03_08075, partial [Hyphomicrobiaceae bacterium]
MASKDSFAYQGPYQDDPSDFLAPHNAQAADPSDFLIQEAPPGDSSPTPLAGGETSDTLGDDVFAYTPEKVKALQERIGDEPESDKVGGELRTVLTAKDALPRNLREFSDKLPFVGLLFSGAESYRLIADANDVKNGTATPEQTKRIEEFAVDQAKRAGADKTFGYYVASILTEAPAFIVEFLATAGIAAIGKAGVRKALGEGAKFAAAKAAAGAAKKAVSEGGEAAAKKLLKDEIENLARFETGKFVDRRVSEGIGRWAAETAGGAVTRTAIGMPHRVFGNLVDTIMPKVNATVDDKGEIAYALSNDQDGFWAALTKAFGRQTVEVATEEMGALLVPVAKLFRGVTPAVKASVLSRWAFLHPGESASGLMKKLRDGGWNGVIGEMFEERMADVLNPAVEAGVDATTTNERFTDAYSRHFSLPTLKQLFAEAVSFGVISGVGIAQEMRSARAKDYRKESVKERVKAAYQEDQNDILGNNVLDFSEQKAIGEAMMKRDPVLKDWEVISTIDQIETPEGRDSYRFVKALAKGLFGADVVFVVPGKDAKRDENRLNGRFLINDTTGRRAIFINAEKPQYWFPAIFGHEYKHTLETDEEFARTMTELQDFVKGSPEIMARVKPELDAIIELYGKTEEGFGEEAAWSEYGARIFETLFADPTFHEKILEEKPTLYGKILEYIQDFFEKIDDFLRTSGIASSYYSKAEMEKQLGLEGYRKMEAMMVKAVRSKLARNGGAAGRPSSNPKSSAEIAKFAGFDAEASTEETMKYGESIYDNDNAVAALVENLVEAETEFGQLIARIDAGLANEADEKSLGVAAYRPQQYREALQAANEARRKNGLDPIAPELEVSRETQIGPEPGKPDDAGAGKAQGERAPKEASGVDKKASEGEGGTIGKSSITPIRDNKLLERAAVAARSAEQEGIKIGKEEFDAIYDKLEDLKASAGEAASSFSKRVAETDKRLALTIANEREESRKKFDQENMGSYYRLRAQALENRQLLSGLLNEVKNSYGKDDAKFNAALDKIMAVNAPELVNNLTGYVRAIRGAENQEEFAEAMGDMIDRYRAITGQKQGSVQQGRYVSKSGIEINKPESTSEGSVTGKSSMTPQRPKFSKIGIVSREGQVEYADHPDTKTTHVYKFAVFPYGSKGFRVTEDGKTVIWSLREIPDEDARYAVENRLKLSSPSHVTLDQFYGRVMGSSSMSDKLYDGHLSFQDKVMGKPKSPGDASRRRAKAEAWQQAMMKMIWSGNAEAERRALAAIETVDHAARVDVELELGMAKADRITGKSSMTPDYEYMAKLGFAPDQADAFAKQMEKLDKSVKDGVDTIFKAARRSRPSKPVYEEDDIEATEPEKKFYLVKKQGRITRLTESQAKAVGAVKVAAKVATLAKVIQNPTTGEFSVSETRRGYIVTNIDRKKNHHMIDEDGKVIKLPANEWYEEGSAPTSTGMSFPFDSGVVLRSKDGKERFIRLAGETPTHWISNGYYKSVRIPKSEFPDAIPQGDELTAHYLGMLRQTENPVRGAAANEAKGGRFTRRYGKELKIKSAEKIPQGWYVRLEDGTDKVLQDDN